MGIVKCEADIEFQICRVSIIFQPAFMKTPVKRSVAFPHFWQTTAFNPANILKKHFFEMLKLSISESSQESFCDGVHFL